MIHLLSRLPAGARVLDLGAAAGSFPDPSPTSVWFAWT